VRDLQPADECECRYILIADGNLGKLALEVVDVGLEDVTLPYLDGNEVIVVLLSFSALGKRLFEEGFKLDENETLSVDSDLNESTSLWWMKINLP